MKFSYSTHVLCSCGLGQKCPDLWRKDGSWNSRHGSAGYACRIPTSAGTRAIKRYGYPSKSAAEQAAKAVGALLDLAADDATRARVGDMIASAKRGAELPDKAVVARRLGLNLDPASPGVTVAEWLEGWLAGKRRAKRASTYRSYESHVRVHILPVIGDLPLERLNASHVEAVLAAVPGSAGTRHRVLATLRAALNAAVKQRQIMHNPCTGVEMEPERPAEAQRWTPEQAARFIAYTADDPLGLLYRVMVLGGGRRSEVCGFRWDGADLEVPYTDPETGEPRLGAVLPVKRMLLQLGGKLHEEATAKTKTGDRLVFLDHDTAHLLRRHREGQELERMVAGEAWQDNDLVFCQGDGRPWLPDHVSKKLKRLAAQAGVPVIKLHEGGRHTGNSLMYDAEVRPDITMRQVGHASKEMSQRYNHPLRQAHLAAAGQVAALVDKAGGTP